MEQQNNHFYYAYAPQVTWLVVNDVWNASFGLVLHSQHIFANSFNFLVTWGLSVTIFHSTCTFFVYMVWHCTGQHCSSMYACTLVCQYVAPLVSVITILSIFHHRLWYHALSLHYGCLFGHHPHPLGNLCAKFHLISFATSIAELVRGEKSHTQSLTQSLNQLIWCPGNGSKLWNINYSSTHKQVSTSISNEMNSQRLKQTVLVRPTDMKRMHCVPVWCFVQQSDMTADLPVWHTYTHSYNSTMWFTICGSPQSNLPLVSADCHFCIVWTTCYWNKVYVCNYVCHLLKHESGFCFW